MSGWQRSLLLGAINGFLGVVLGAFGAHILEPTLSADLMRVWNKGVDYQQLHALALVLVGLLQKTGADGPCLRRSASCFAAGILLFSGSLYLLALTGIRPLGAITPLGGVSFLLGWGFLAWSAVRPKGEQECGK